MFFFIILFAITAPLVVFFATGYRFDNKTGIFVHSGSITLKSWPRDVEIFLDGKKQESKRLNNINNSYTINGVRPGHYLLKCEKEGYTAWEKEIDVHSGISTEFWNVVLFPLKNQEIKSYDTNSISQFFLSPRDNDEIIYLGEKTGSRTVGLLNIQSSETKELFSTNELYFLQDNQKENIEWSSDNKKIMIPLLDKKGQKQYFLAKAEKESLKEVVSLNQLFEEVFPKADPAFHNARWMFDKNDEVIILSNDHKLYYFYLEQPENSFIIDENVSSFDFAGNRIYYSQLPNNLVWEIRDNNKSTKRQITNISASSGKNEFLDLFVYDEYRVALINESKQLFVFNEEKEKGEKTMSEIGSPVEMIQFSNDGKKMLYWTGNEIWNLMLRDWEVQPLRKKDDRFMITRFSEPIGNVQWMDDYENIIFSVGNLIKSVELDVRSRTNIVDVAKTDYPLKEKDVIFSKQSRILFFKNKFGENLKIQSQLLVDKGGFLNGNFKF